MYLTTEETLDLIECIENARAEATKRGLTVSEETIRYAATLLEHALWTRAERARVAAKEREIVGIDLNIKCMGEYAEALLLTEKMKQKAAEAEAGYWHARTTMMRSGGGQ